MLNETKQLLDLADGASLVASPSMDQYWFVKSRGDRTRLTIQQAVQIWRLYQETGDGKRIRVADPQTLSAGSGRSALQVLPCIESAPEPGLFPASSSVLRDEPATPETCPSGHEERTARVEILLRRMGLDHESIQAAVSEGVWTRSGG